MAVAVEKALVKPGRLQIGHWPKQHCSSPWTRQDLTNLTPSPLPSLAIEAQVTGWCKVNLDGFLVFGNVQPRQANNNPPPVFGPDAVPCHAVRLSIRVWAIAVLFETRDLQSNLPFFTRCPAHGCL